MSRSLSTHSNAHKSVRGVRSTVDTALRIPHCLGVAALLIYSPFYQDSPIAAVYGAKVAKRFRLIKVNEGQEDTCLLQAQYLTIPQWEFSLP